MSNLFMKKPQWIICFLGNPGERYARTRHNAGWMVCELFEARGVVKTTRLKYHAFTGTGELGGASVLFMRPQTYMNLSGEALAPAAQFYKIPPEHCIVIQDDTALPIGKLRIRRGGSDGGHKGIRSITQQLGTPDYLRIKIGVGAPDNPEYDFADWVTSRLGDSDLKIIAAAACRAADAAGEIIGHGVDSAMNKYNGN